ncbi:DNA helicase [Sulfolobus spindle-shaped virus 7]|uniref:Rad3-like helicase n=1 Tax=Sulfolobus spindle-shaped virus 7 TaxID=693628 RepID=D1GF63_9VIRU|nr:DNA helicase [Sulfolobus spindle-shaped virus 7]ACZ35765.1 Rad3-like helicase [Sulfolobus spindle-shaped virus 7]
MILRDYQEAIVKKAVEALSNGRGVVINAPTGTGKTIMALETLRRLDKIGWVYVRTISQYSSWERDAKKLGLSFTGLMRKGEFCKVLKKPYVLYCTMCDQEVDEKEDVDHIRKHKKFIERKYISPTCYDNNAIPKWAGFCHYRPEYIARKFDEGEDAIEFVSEVTKKMKSLLDEGGIKYTANWFRDNEFKFKNKSFDVCVYKLIEGSAWIRIYSYIYFFLGLRRPKEDSSDDIVVFDEAHNLDDFNINSVTLTLKEVLGFFSKIHIEEISQEKLKQEVEEAFKEFVKDPDQGFGYLNFIVDEELAEKFSTVIKAWKERDKWYIERDETYIKVMPADPAIWLSKLNDYRFILLSGTMPSSDYLKTVWGISNFVYINAMSLYSSTSLRNHFAGAQIYVDDSIYYIKENRPSYREKIAELIRKYSVKDGLNLVVLPSYNELEAFKPLFFGNAFFEDIRPDVLDRVKRLPNGYIVLAVAGGKLSEGIEVLDADGKSRIKTIFIIGLPLPEYKDPFLDKMISTVAKRVGRDPKSFKWVVLYEKAIVKVKQALGRAIRGPQDSAVIYLIDKRFTYKNVIQKMGLEVAKNA